MDWMLTPIWTFFQDQLKNAILTICQNLLGLIASGTSGFWDMSLISTFIGFSKWVNMVVFAVSVLFMLFDIAEEQTSGKAVDYGVVFSNTVKAMIFVNFNASLAMMAMAISDIVTTRLNFKVPTDDSVISNQLAIAFPNIVFLIFILLFVLVACLVFFVMSVMRYGSMFVLIMASSFYIPDILRGDTTSIGAWLRQMVAIAGTYIFQYITFYCGLYYLIQANIIVCFICWAGMASAEKVLQKYGYSSGTKGFFGATGSLAGTGISLATKL